MMIERIKEILSEFKNIDGFKILEEKIESRELFLIKRDLDMNRAKEVHNLSVTVYKDFQEEGAKFKGSSTAKIHPTMKDEEIREAIEGAAFAAQFVKNKFYPLVKPLENNSEEIKTNLNEKSLDEWLPHFISAIQNQDIYEKGSINSAEVFINRIYTRILNSEGVDVSFENYRGQIEIIVNWKEEKEEVELYKNIDFASFDKALIEKTVKDMLLQCRERAVAEETPGLGKHTVLLSEEAVKDFLGYYYTNSDAQEVYQQSSTAKLGENIQGVNPKGDLVNMMLDPFMENSTKSAPYDMSGYPLSRVSVFKDGVLNRYWGDNQYAHYLSIKPTGNIENFVVDGGRYSLEELRKEPYLEIAAFSSFDMDSVTGNFGGELRLGWYFNGSERLPVTGGSISGNIKDVHGEMYLSKELQKINNFVGPQCIKLLGVTVSGK